MSALLDERPIINEMINNTRNMKNNILAIEAAPAAIPPNPNTAAIIATIKNITVQRNITDNFKVKGNRAFYILYILSVLQACTNFYIRTYYLLSFFFFLFSPLLVNLTLPSSL